MNEFEDALKIAGQGLIAFFLLAVISVLFASIDFGVNFNPFENLLSTSLLAISLILIGLFIFFIVWIVKEFLDLGNRL